MYFFLHVSIYWWVTEYEITPEVSWSCWAIYTSGNLPIEVSSKTSSSDVEQCYKFERMRQVNEKQQLIYAMCFHQSMLYSNVRILFYFLHPFIVRLLLSTFDVCRLFLKWKGLAIICDFLIPPIYSEKHPFLVLQILNHDAVPVPVSNTSFIFFGSIST